MRSYRLHYNWVRSAPAVCWMSLPIRNSQHYCHTTDSHIWNPLPTSLRLLHRFTKQWSSSKTQQWWESPKQTFTHTLTSTSQKHINTHKTPQKKKTREGETQQENQNKHAFSLHSKFDPAGKLQEFDEDCISTSELSGFSSSSWLS